jgi:nitroimidazol reductase NimA-like FMN-containing flavoprotein (pyridoxamine 5'-phosphate oxidase superfamily)
MITPLSVENARQLLRSCHFARLACVVNGDPFVVPINYKFDSFDLREAMLDRRIRFTEGEENKHGSVV